MGAAVSLKHLSLVEQTRHEFHHTLCTELPSPLTPRSLPTLHVGNLSPQFT